LLALVAKYWPEFEIFQERSSRILSLPFRSLIFCFIAFLHQCACLDLSHYRLSLLSL
jgi:hypothetical protein